MPFYNRAGKIPPKRHTAFYNGKKIYYEELISRQGFSGIYSNIYHINRPTKVIKVCQITQFKILIGGKKHRTRHITTSKISNSNIINRNNLFFNSDVIISILNLNKTTSFFYKNGIEDEVFYVQSGYGCLATNFGDLLFKSGDYIIIPRGVI